MAGNSQSSRRKSRRIAAYILGACLWCSATAVHADSPRITSSKILSDQKTVADWSATGGVAENGLLIVVQFSAGPSLGSSLVRSIVDSLDRRFVSIQYLPISRVMSDTEYRAALRSLQLVIQVTRPRFILSLDDDYLKYMPQNTIDEYKGKYLVVNSGVSALGRPSCELIEKIAQRTYVPETPIYIIRDDNSAHLESAKALSACMKEFGHEVSVFSSDTLSDLRSNLLRIAGQPKGYLISLVSTVQDVEFNRPVGLDEINSLIIKTNKRHIDFGFVRANTNLSVMIIPSLEGVALDEKMLANIRTLPRLYVSIDRLNQLKGDLVYKNLFQDINGVLDN